MQKKHIILIGSGIVVALSISIGMTLAYLHSNDNKDNTLNIAGNTTEISENFEEPSKQNMQNTITKEIKVSNNTGSVPCFVRVYAAFSDSKIASLAKVSSDGSTYQTWADFKTGLVSDTAGDWQYIAETDNTDDKLGGYFYYKKIIYTKENTENKPYSTSELIKAVQINYADEGESTNIDEIQDYKMIIYSETVQAVEIDGTEYSDSDWKTAWEKFLKVRS